MTSEIKRLKSGKGEELKIGVHATVLTLAVVCFFFSSRRRHTRSVSAFLLNRSSDLKQELLLLVYELNRSGLLAENEKIRPILAQLEKLLLCDLSPSTNDSVKN